MAPVHRCGEERETGSGEEREGSRGRSRAGGGVAVAPQRML